MSADSRILTQAARRLREEAEARRQRFYRHRLEIYRALPRTEEIDRLLRTTAGRIVAEAL